MRPQGCAPCQPYFAMESRRNHKMPYPVTVAARWRLPAGTKAGLDPAPRSRRRTTCRSSACWAQDLIDGFLLTHGSHPMEYQGGLLDIPDRNVMAAPTGVTRPALFPSRLADLCCVVPSPLPPLAGGVRRDAAATKPMIHPGRDSRHRSRSAHRQNMRPGVASGVPRPGARSRHEGLPAETDDGTVSPGNPRLRQHLRHFAARAASSGLRARRPSLLQGGRPRESQCCGIRHRAVRPSRHPTPPRLRRPRAVPAPAFAGRHGRRAAGVPEPRHPV